jgi:nifR3 family TIM-barrel protein
MTSFWHSLKKPILALAPMEDVTDTVFRQVIAACGRPDVMFTEFTSVEGIQSVGQAKVIHRLQYTENERPLVAQIWGVTPQDYFKTGMLVKELGFDGLDINMGCPVKNVIKQGACSALIKNPSLAKEIICAAKEGVGPNIPVSVKTRIGFKTIQTEEWIGFLLRECSPEVLTIHGRTVAEASKVPVHWEEIQKAVEIKKQLGSQTLIIGNGDILSLSEAHEKATQYGLDGIMIGRGVFQNPWIFNSDIDINQVTVQKRLETLLFHIQLYEQTWGGQKNYQILKRFFKIYVTGFTGAAQLRAKLMETKHYSESIQLAREFLKKEVVD